MRLQHIIRLFLPFTSLGRRTMANKSSPESQRMPLFSSLSFFLFFFFFSFFSADVFLHSSHCARSKPTAWLPLTFAAAADFGRSQPNPSRICLIYFCVHFQTFARFPCLGRRASMCVLCVINNHKRAIKDWPTGHEHEQGQQQIRDQRLLPYQNICLERRAMCDDYRYHHLLAFAAAAAAAPLRFFGARS